MAEFAPISVAAFRKGATKSRGPHTTSARFDRRHHRIVIELDTGVQVSFDPKCANGLKDADPDDLAGVRVAGAGGTIHFPKLDEFFSVANLMEGFFGPMDWARKEAQVAASQRNGKLGGRPRKCATVAA